MYKNILFIIFGLLLINFYWANSFYENYLGKNLYENKDYSGSILKFEKSGNIYGVYNKANSLYKQKKYGEVIKEYKSILTNKKNELNFRINNNIGNSFYRIGENNKDTEIKIKNWEESVNFYTDALNIKYDEKTKKNLEFVLKKIKEEKSKKQNKDSKQNNKNSNSSSKTGSGTSQKNNTSKTGSGASQKNSSSKTGSGASQKNNTSKTGSGTSQKNSGEGKLSEEQNKALEQYTKALNEEQKNNADSFNKVYKENKSNDAFDNFFNDPFFNNDLLNNTNEKKDW